MKYNLSGAHKFELDQSRVRQTLRLEVRVTDFECPTVLANERTQIRSDLVPGMSVDTLGGYRVGIAITRSESDAARAG